jgi:hypothetical protein
MVSYGRELSSLNQAEVLSMVLAELYGLDLHSSEPHVT